MLAFSKLVIGDKNTLEDDKQNHVSSYFHSIIFYV